MTPENIKRMFGEDSLNMLYDCLLQNPVHELADWILSYHDEQQIGDWIFGLKADEEETE
jgi:hypothetical protein